MEYLEQILVVIFFVSIAIFGYSQWRKSRNLHKVYSQLTKEEKKEIDKNEYQNPEFLAYVKPINKSLWLAVFIGAAIVLWALLSQANAL